MTKPLHESLPFFLTKPGPCPYLPGRQERKAFTRLNGKNAVYLNDILSQHGFRRSQSIAYRPVCEGCDACISVRIPVSSYRFSKSERRILNRNRDLIRMKDGGEPAPEHYDLFRDYVSSRHFDGNMAEMSTLDFLVMIEDSYVNTRLIEYRQRHVDSGITGAGGRLMAASVTDYLQDGLSLVYSFFDVEEAKRSLGSYVILDHIRLAQSLGLPHLYLGYWVEGSPKMDYKANFLPQERLTRNGWVLVEG